MTSPRGTNRSILEDPWLAAALGLTAILVAGLLVLPGILDGGSNATPGPGGSPGTMFAP